jgi:hypothetical protein
MMSTILATPKKDTCPTRCGRAAEDHEATVHDEGSQRMHAAKAFEDRPGWSG